MAGWQDVENEQAQLLTHKEPTGKALPLWLISEMPSLIPAPATSHLMSPDVRGTVLANMTRSISCSGNISTSWCTPSLQSYFLILGLGCRCLPTLPHLPQTWWSSSCCGHSDLLSNRFPLRGCGVLHLHVAPAVRLQRLQRTQEP